MAYERMTMEELLREIELEEREVERLKGEYDRVSRQLGELAEEVEKERKEADRLRGEYYRVSAELRELTSSLEALETAIIPKRADLARLVPERERARGRVRYWRGRRRILRGRRIRLEREYRRRSPYWDVITRVSKSREIEEARKLEREAEANYRRYRREYLKLGEEIRDLRAELGKEERELREVRRRIERLPSPIDLLTELRRIEDREIPRKQREIERFIARLDKILAEIAEIEAEIEKKKKALPRYVEWEFAKYYKYEKGPTYRRRHFEIRATFTLPAGVDPDDVKDMIERRFDDVMLKLGIDVALFDKGWIDKGAEQVGITRTFRSTVDAVVEDKRRGFVWREPKYPTRISIREEEVSA